MRLTKSDKERFQAKVDRKGPNECWDWIGAKYENGYGQFSLRRKGVVRKTYLAHRMSWMIHNAQGIPRGKMICHTCDRRHCVNPNHLYAGTGYDNNGDTIRRKRGNRRLGEACSWSKLSEADVLHIRNSVERQTVLAARFNIDQSTVSQIQHGLRWKHLLQK